MRIPKLKVPKMKIPKMKKRQKQLLIIGFIMIGFLFASPYLFGTETTKNIFDYGTVSYKVNTLGVLTDLQGGNTVDSLVSDIRVQFTWNTALVSAPLAGDFHVILWNGWYNQIEDVSATKSGNVFTFDFGLLNCYSGTYDYYFTLYADRWITREPPRTQHYQGDSFVFKISNLVQITEAPTFEELPGDIPEAVIGYPETIMWTFKYSAECTSKIYQDDIEVASRVFEAGNVFTQSDFYVFNPTERGSYQFKIVITPTYALHTPISDIMSVGVVTFEDFGVIDEIPEGLEAIALIMDSQVSTLGWAVHNEWLLNMSVPVDVYGVPKTGEMTIKLAYSLVPGIVVDILGETKILLTGADEQQHEFVMNTVIDIDFTFFGITINSWKEVIIDLDQLAAGEYQAEVRTIALGRCYRLVQFSLSVNTFPFGLVATYAGYIVLFSVISIVSIKGLREAKGWWSFQGRYNKTRIIWEDNSWRKGAF